MTSLLGSPCESDSPPSGNRPRVTISGTRYYSLQSRGSGKIIQSTRPPKTDLVNLHALLREIEQDLPQPHGVDGQRAEVLLMAAHGFPEFGCRPIGSWWSPVWG